MKEAMTFLQNAGAIAFVLLGLATAVGWAKRRDRSLGFLALAIVLLSIVSLLGRIPAGYQPPLLPQISLLIFMGSGYALLRFRGSLIPLHFKWHAIAVVAMVGASCAFLAAQGLAAAGVASTSLLTVAGIVLVLVWSATILEPIIRLQNGLALTRQLKADPATAAIPIIPLTAHAMASDREKALAAGCIGYISKPIDTRTLSDQLQEFLPPERLESGESVDRQPF